MPLSDSFKKPRSPVINITSFEIEEDSGVFPVIRRTVDNPFFSIAPNYIPPPNYNIAFEQFTITENDDLPPSVNKPTTLTGGVYGGSSGGQITVNTGQNVFSAFEVNSNLTFGTLPGSGFGFRPFLMFWAQGTMHMLCMNVSTLSSDPFYRRLCYFKMTQPWHFEHQNVAGIRDYVSNSFSTNEDFVVRKTNTGVSVFWKVTPVAFGTPYGGTAAWNATGVVRIEFNDNGAINTYFEPYSHLSSITVDPIDYFLDAATDNIVITDNSIAPADISFRGVRWGDINVYNKIQNGSGFPFGGNTITPQVNGWNREVDFNVWTENLIQPSPQTESIKTGTVDFFNALFSGTGSFTFEEITQAQSHDGSIIYRLRSGASGTPLCSNGACSSSLPYNIAIQIIKQPLVNIYNLSALYERPDNPASGNNFLGYWGHRLSSSSYNDSMSDRFGNTLALVNSPAVIYLAKSKTWVRLDQYNGGSANVSPPIITTVKIPALTPYGFAVFSMFGSSFNTAQKKLRFFLPN